MLRRQPVLWLGLALSSCMVSSFDIVDELPGSAGSSSAAGSSNGGADGKAGNASAGSDIPSAGTTTQGGSAQGGAMPQAGDGNVNDAGEPALAGAGQGGAPAEMPALPCDKDEQGMAPLLCDDFESGAFDVTKWEPPPGIKPESTMGPHGTTLAVQLPGVPLGTNLLLFNLDASGAELTLSFWFKILSDVSGDARLVGFQSSSGTPIDLKKYLKEIIWEANNDVQAPSKPPPGAVNLQEWYCVSLYLTSVHMDISYVSAAAPATVHTAIIDDVATAGVDDLWQNYPPEPRKIQGQPSFGASPVFPSEIIIDDVRIVRGKSNVCGI